MSYGVEEKVSMLCGRRKKEAFIAERACLREGDKEKEGSVEVKN